MTEYVQYTLLMENQLRKIQILVYTWDMTQLPCIKIHALVASEENMNFLILLDPICHVCQITSLFIFIFIVGGINLSNRFGTTTSVVSSILNTWIKVLAKCLRGIIHYPDKISARENLPDCFNNSYPNDVQLTVQNFSSRNAGNY
jgi:hypothetical protein